MFQTALKVAVVRGAGLRPPVSLVNNRQRRYRYKLLAAPISQPTRDILLVTLCTGEEQAPPGELAKGYDEWFRNAGRGLATLRQRLARMITEGTNIKSTSGTEYTELVEPEPFQGSIAPFARHKEEGALEAKRYTDGPGEMSFWTDWSRQDSGDTRASVV